MFGILCYNPIINVLKILPHRHRAEIHPRRPEEVEGVGMDLIFIFFMKEPNKKIIQRKIVAGAVVNKGKILIIQRSANENFYPNLWELPSGKREPLEKTEDALIREIKEETGLNNIEIVEIISVSDYMIEKDDFLNDATQINFLVRIKGDAEVKLSQDHQNFAWIGREEIDNYDITKETKEVIKEAFGVI